MKKFFKTGIFILSIIFLFINYVQATDFNNITDSNTDISKLPICDKVKEELRIKKCNNDSSRDKTIDKTNGDSNKKENYNIEEQSRDLYYIEEIPLCEELQKYTYDLCKINNISYDLVLAIMQYESNFDTTAFAYNKNGSFDSGLMQINSCNADELKDDLGITDLQNPYNNILAGISILSKHILNLGEHDGLMAYNMGLGGYYQTIRNGAYSTKYVDKILNKRDEISKMLHTTN